MEMNRICDWLLSFMTIISNFPCTVFSPAIQSAESPFTEFLCCTCAPESAENVGSNLMMKTNTDILMATGQTELWRQSIKLHTHARTHTQPNAVGNKFPSHWIVWNHATSFVKVGIMQGKLARKGTDRAIISNWSTLNNNHSKWYVLHVRR